MNAVVQPLSPGVVVTIVAASCAPNVGHGHRHLGDVMDAHDLRLPHFALLTALTEFGPLAQHDLADRLGLNRSHLVGYLDDVERRGLVARERDPEDRRRQRVALTADGKSLQRKLMREAERAEETFLAPLSAEERTVFTGLLARLLAAEAN